GRDQSSAQLGGPIHRREAARDLSTHEGPQGYGRVEVATRDAPEGGDHDANRETVGERDQQEVAARKDPRTRSNENEREGPDPFTDGLASRRDRQLRLPSRRIGEVY